MMRSNAWAAVVMAGVCSVAGAEVRLPALISDHMVLEQQTPARVWGWASPAEHVTIRFAGQSTSTVANDAGRWSVWLQPMTPSDSGDMTIEGTNKLVVHDVLVGEVWVAAGQSNMERAVHFSNNYATVQAHAANPQLRLFHADHAVSPQPADDIRGHWELADAKTISNFAAAAYFFGDKLQHEKHLPVGLIESAYGGTQIEAWMSQPSLEGDPALAFVGQEWSQVLAHMPESMADYESKLTAWKAKLSKEDQKLVANGKLLLGAPPKPRGEGSQAEPSGLYNGMIAPLTQYSIRGILWNQGENNAGANSYRYRNLMIAMIRDWRSAFSQGDLPFIFMQLSRYRGGGFAVLRESQKAALTLTNTAMVVTADVGMVEDVHYPDKQTLGGRLLLAADNLAYGADVTASGPILQKVTVDGSKLRLWFQPSRAALVLKTPAVPEWATLTPNTPPELTADGKAILFMPPTAEALARAFVIAGSDGKFYPARPEIQGATLVLSSDRVAQPTQVCYAWEDKIPAMPLWNSAALPASPFRAALDGRAEPECPDPAQKPSVPR